MNAPGSDQKRESGDAKMMDNMTSDQHAHRRRWSYKSYSGVLTYGQHQTGRCQHPNVYFQRRVPKNVALRPSRTELFVPRLLSKTFHGHMYRTILSCME